MKVVVPNTFGPGAAQLGARRVATTTLGRALQALYAGVEDEPLPETLLAIARRIDGRASLAS